MPCSGISCHTADICTDTLQALQGEEHVTDEQTTIVLRKSTQYGTVGSAHNVKETIQNSYLESVSHLFSSISISLSHDNSQSQNKTDTDLHDGHLKSIRLTSTCFKALLKVDTESCKRCLFSDVKTDWLNTLKKQTKPQHLSKDLAEIIAASKFLTPKFLSTVSGLQLSSLTESVRPSWSPSS